MRPRRRNTVVRFRKPFRAAPLRRVRNGPSGRGGGIVRRLSHLLGRWRVALLASVLLVLAGYDMWRGGAAAHWTFLPWSPEATATDREAAWFEVCNGPIRYTCVIDGDTIWYRGEKFRVLGIDAPEVSEPGCEREAQLGERATLALRDVLNEGPFSLEPDRTEPEEDAYGRALRRITRGGVDLGERLVRQGLAVRDRSAAPGWCPAGSG